MCIRDSILCRSREVPPSDPPARRPRSGQHASQIPMEILAEVTWKLNEPRIRLPDVSPQQEPRRSPHGPGASWARYRILNPASAASSAVDGFLVDAVFTPADHLEETFAVEFESAHIVFNGPCDAVDRNKECELAAAKRVEEFLVPFSNAENALPIGHELHLGKMTIHATVAAKVVPRPANPLHRHAVVQQ